MTKQKYASKEHSHDFFEWIVIIGFILFFIIVCDIAIDINNLEQSLQDDVECGDVWELEYRCWDADAPLITAKFTRDFYKLNDYLEYRDYLNKSKYCELIETKQKCSEDER